MATDESDFSYFRLRIPADLKAKIEAAAQEAGRSLNAQVLFSIQASFSQAGDIEEMRGAIEEHEGRINDLEKDVSRLLDATGLSYYER